MIVDNRSFMNENIEIRDFGHYYIKMESPLYPLNQAICVGFIFTLFSFKILKPPLNTCKDGFLDLSCFSYYSLRFYDKMNRNIHTVVATTSPYRSSTICGITNIINADWIIRMVSAPSSSPMR